MMTNDSKTTVIRAFTTRGEAEKALDSLRHAGFSEDQLGIAGPGEPIGPDPSPTARLERSAEKGAEAGAVAGSTVGAVAGGLAVALIPGIGPVAAGGILLGILGGAAAGGAAGALAGPFLRLGLTQDDAAHYAHHIKEGRTLVIVQAEGRALEASEILDRKGEVGIR
jgi:hypothetical protein